MVGDNDGANDETDEIIKIWLITSNTRLDCEVNLKLFAPVLISLSILLLLSNNDIRRLLCGLLLCVSLCEFVLLI